MQLYKNFLITNRSSLLAFISVLSLIVLGVLWLVSYIPVLVKDNAEREAVNMAKSTAYQFKILRSYYTKNVIQKIISNESVKPAINHKGIADRIPLPATMIHELSKLFEPGGSNIKIYSNFPFPHRASRQLDDFEKSAWQHLKIDSSSPFFRTEMINGKTYVRVAIADIMTDQSCVNCHNSHPDTPKTDWKLGDLRGVLEVQLSIEDQLFWAEKLSNKLLISLMLVLIFCIAIFGWYIVYSAKRKLVKEKQLEAINIYNSMLKANQHILNNLLNQMILFKIEAENCQDFNPEILILMDKSLDEASDLLKNLSEVEHITDSNIWASINPAEIYK